MYAVLYIFPWDTIILHYIKIKDIWIDRYRYMPASE